MPTVSASCRLFGWLGLGFRLCLRLVRCLGLGCLFDRFPLRRLGQQRLGLGAGLAGTQLADAGLLADLLAQVVELRAVDVADRGDLDLVDLGRVQREGPLDTDSERLLANGERLVQPGALALQDDALEDLDAAAL